MLFIVLATPHNVQNLIAILYPQVLWILTSTCVPVLFLGAYLHPRISYHDTGFTKSKKLWIIFQIMAPKIRFQHIRFQAHTIKEAGPKGFESRGLPDQMDNWKLYHADQSGNDLCQVGWSEEQWMPGRQRR